MERRNELELVVYVDSDRASVIQAALDVTSVVPVPSGWEDAWRAFHRPVRVGPLWIGPPWESPPPNTIAVVVEPGRAFGTGAHPTTRLCLELLLEEEPRAVVDLGCGSGVLAVAAAKLGFAPVRAIDVDEAAVESTRWNATANGVAVEARLADVLSDGLPAAELALANLELGLVEALAARPLPPRIVVSGFLAADSPACPGWRRVARRELDGWAAESLARVEAR